MCTMMGTGGSSLRRPSVGLNSHKQRTSGSKECWFTGGRSRGCAVVGPFHFAYYMVPQPEVGNAGLPNNTQVKLVMPTMVQDTGNKIN